MAQSRVIGGYLADLSAQLPASIVAELADGLEQPTAATSART